MSKCDLGPKSIAIVASTLATAGVTRVDLSGNGLSGATLYSNGSAKDGVDSDLAGITSFCEALPSSKITELLISKCGLGPKSIAIVAATLATTRVAEVDISMNLISGSKHYDNNFSYGVVEFDTDVSQLEAFGSAISKSSVTAIKMTRCGLGSDAMSTLCAAGLFSTLASIDLSGNFISGTKCKSGSYMSNVIDSSTIDSNMTSIVALSETLQSSAITHMNISNCSLGPKSITIVASSLATAGVETMDLSNNPFDPGDLEAPANMKISVDGCAIPESDADDY